MPMPKKDLRGQVFGRWTVLREAGRANKQVLWECRCICGTIRDIRGGTLRQGLSASCGECTDHGAALRTKHGLGGTKIYDVWYQMLQRCENPQSPDFGDYGRRGIAVCARWHDVELFVEDMGMPPAGLTLDRVDVEGDYESENCRWVPQKEQTRNARSNINITYAGRMQCLGAWAEELNINYSTLYGRYVTRGLPFDECVNPRL